MKNDKIILHPKYGLNPTIMCCAWCGKEKGIALLGNSYKEQAPQHMILDIEPCEECKEIFSQGILVAEVEDMENPYPKRFFVATEDIVRQIFADIPDKQFNEMIKKKAIFVMKGILPDSLFKAVKQAYKEREEKHPCHLCPHASCCKEKEDE